MVHGRPPLTGVDPDTSAKEIGRQFLLESPSDGVSRTPPAIRCPIRVAAIVASVGYVSSMPDVGATIRRRVVVRGRVQGVFFRDTCRREARTRGVNGWVRNSPDGSVEAVFEGGAKSVEAMIAWANRGPDLAEVTGLEVIEEAPQGETRFRVA